MEIQSTDGGARTGSGPRRLLPIVEVLMLGAALVAPLLLEARPELITLATNVLILSLLAISFDLCWGYSGIMSFGQACSSGSPATSWRWSGGISSSAMPSGRCRWRCWSGCFWRWLFAAFLLLGRRTPTVIFVALGTLTGSYAAERLVSGWQYVGAGNGLSAVKLLQIGSFELVEGTAFYFLALSRCCWLCYLAARYLWFTRSSAWCWPA